MAFIKSGIGTVARRRLCSAAAPPHLRIISVNDVYELHALPRLKSLVDAHRRQQQQHGGILLATVNGDFVSPSILSGMDQGQSMIHALNQIPITHACFGNHEADLQLPDLRRRVVEFTSRGGVWLNSNMPSFRPSLPPWDIVDLPEAGLQVGVLGLLTSEPSIFRKDKFRGLPIDDMLSSASHWSAVLREQHGVSAVIALTHQTIGADLALAESGAVDLVLGGHEHEVMYEQPQRGAPVVKSGSDAHTAAVVDIHFGEVRSSGVRWRRGPRRSPAAGEPQPAQPPLRIDVRFEDVTAQPPQPALEAEVDVHLSVLRALETEAVCTRDSYAALAGRPLSSMRTRFEQTTVGALLASTCRDALQTQVAMINGGTIKGNAEYEAGELTYLALQRELPFPTKMVVVSMPGAVLQDAVRHSRAGEPTDERRAYLQLDEGVRVAAADDALLEVAGAPFDAAATYSVAVPRNLLKGAFEIAPLIAWGREAAAELPDEDAFVPALNLILNHNSRNIWRRLGSFDELDLDGDGELTRPEVVAALTQRFGHAPSSIMVDNVMRALDEDESGTISRQEYEALNKPVR